MNRERGTNEKNSASPWGNELQKEKKTLTWPLTDSTRARTRCRTLTTFMAISLPVCLSTPT